MSEISSPPSAIKRSFLQNFRIFILGSVRPLGRLMYSSQIMLDIEQFNHLQTYNISITESAAKLLLQAPLIIDVLRIDRDPHIVSSMFSHLM